LTLVLDLLKVVTVEKELELKLLCFLYYKVYDDYMYYCSGNCSPRDIGIPRISPTQGHFALYNCLVLGHSKYTGVERVYCNPFFAKPFHSSHRLDMVMIRPLGIDNGAFVVSPDTVWYARVLLLYSASAMTDTGSKSFECALVSTLETYDDPANGNYIH
jgi:hypothetical protein